MPPHHVSRARTVPGAWVQALIIGWVLTWLVVGVIAVLEVRSLSTLSDTLDTSATALDTAGAALETIGALPIIGAGPQRLGAEVRAASADARRSAAASRGSIHALSVLLGLSLALIPTAPVVGFHLYLTGPGARDVAQIRRALADPRPAPRLDQYLAWRAVQNLSYDELTRVSEDPWRDLQQGRVDGLADAELRRLRIRRPGGR